VRYCSEILIKIKRKNGAITIHLAVKG